MARAKVSKRARRSFTDEFKAGGAALVLDEGKSMSQVARDLDLTTLVLSGWVRLARTEAVAAIATR